MMTKKSKSTSKKADLSPIILTSADLPLSCPREGVQVWNLHPKVYLPIEKSKEEICPYCSAHYVLADSK